MSQEDLERYERAVHAMQSGVAHEMNYDRGPTSGKHLRVGVNSAMCEAGALAELLISKGLITEEEYAKALADMMEREVRRYEEKVSARMGADVKLG